MADPRIRLLLVDDHQIVRAGLRMLLQTEPDIEIVGEASSGDEALQAARTLHPDVIVMDIAMSGMGGIEATRQIKSLCPNTAVLALTMYEDEQHFFAMLHAGASGYVPKRAAPDELAQAIRAVSRGEVFLYPTLARVLVREFTQPAQGPRPELTPRELEVLTLIAEGYTNRQIAERLYISVKTVDRHRENILRKLHLHSRVELVRYALERGLIPQS